MLFRTPVSGQRESAVRWDERSVRLVVEYSVKNTLTSEPKGGDKTVGRTF